MLDESKPFSSPYFFWRAAKKADAYRPDQAWVGDITYIPTVEGWLYLAIVKDLCPRKVAGYAFSDRIYTALTLEALRMAYNRQKPNPGASSSILIAAYNTHPPLTGCS